MTKYEKLMAEYEGICYMREQSGMVHEGLYSDGCIAIKKELPEKRKTPILAEEIGHFELSVGNILDLKEMANLKQEYKARVWAYKKLVQPEDIYEAVSNGYTTVWDIADYLDIDEIFLAECLKYYGILDI